MASARLLIDGNGTFNTSTEQYLNLASESRPAAVVSIIGPQSSGKSTLLNHLFGTNFAVMNQANGMSQTTKGIWVTKCPSPRGGSPILVIDTEGSDGCEREDDVKFEKQTALFSLAISSTVILNMKCDDVNRNNGGGWVLLRTVLEVMLRRFSTPRKVNLVFVLRDKNQVPLDILKRQVVGGVGRMWAGIIRHQAAQEIAPLQHYFQIEVVTMSHYRQEPMDFATELACLKEQIMHWTAASGEPSRETIADSGFAAYAKNIWDVIKEDKDLDLPQQWIMVAQVRCKAIAVGKYKSFLEDKSWLETKKQVEDYPEIIQHFGQKVSSIYKSYLSQYDRDAHYYHHTQRDEYKEQLAEKLMQDIRPTYRILVGRMFQATLEKFLDAAKQEFDEDIALDNMKTQRYIEELQSLLKDAAIEGINPDYATKQIDLLRSTMNTIIAKATIAVTEHVPEETDKGNVWLNIASLVTNLLGTGARVAGIIMGAGN